MASGNESSASAKLCFVLAGLEAGMLAGLVMLAWLAAASAFQHRSVWAVPNLLATTFYGESALRQSFGAKTLAGLALHLFVYSLLGAAFGIVVQHRGTRLRLTLLGILSALAWHYFSFGFFWKTVNPLVMLYSPDRPMLVGHLLYGGLLGRFPDFLRSVEKGLTL